jgi:hypothetical protein
MKEEAIIESDEEEGRHLCLDSETCHLPPAIRIIWLKVTCDAI